MENKVNLFFDIDGVLNTTDYISSLEKVVCGTPNFSDLMEKDLVENLFSLSSICDFYFSSDWTVQFDDATIIKALQDNGWKGENLKFIARTFSYSRKRSRIFRTIRMDGIPLNSILVIDDVYENTIGFPEEVSALVVHPSTGLRLQEFDMVKEKAQEIYDRINKGT